MYLVVYIMVKTQLLVQVFPVAGMPALIARMICKAARPTDWKKV